MIPRDCKRLAEVDFPIADVSRRALADKRVRTGHPASIHVWWARRPLASSRAMLLALLLPDPVDPHCPVEFKDRSRTLLRQAPDCNPGNSDSELRQALLNFIGTFASWDLQTNSTYLHVSRGLVEAAHGADRPLVVDPFSGGGSIPLEALRLGCEAYASDLNPVSYMILKIVLGLDGASLDSLIDEFSRASTELTREIDANLRCLYPSANGREAVGYFWARTVKCESPSCGAEIPLLKSFWLSKSRASKAAIRYQIDRKAGEIPSLKFEIFQPDSDSEVPAATVSRARARCACCGAVLHPDRVRSQLREHRGGTDVLFDEGGSRIGGARLMAVAEAGRTPDRRFRLPVELDYEGIRAAQRRLRESNSSTSNGPSIIPDEPLVRVPVSFGVINVWLYGMRTWGDLFSARQAFAVATIARAISSLPQRGYGQTTQALLAFALNIFARTCNGNARLRPDGSAAPAFGMQALPFTWAFPESLPWGTRAETFAGALESVLEVLRGPALRVPHRAQVQLCDARHSLLPDESAAVWFTDPPYYDAIPYSHLSDFFYVWMKRSIGAQYPNVFAGLLTPKGEEIVSYKIPNSNEPPTRRFDRMMGEAFAEGRRILGDTGIASVVFAHKTTEGWEALLSGIVRSGWTVTASWPIATEAENRLRARNAAALATSVHLICRPRPSDSGIGDWSDVLCELPGRVTDWMTRLEDEGVRGADLVFACIGPALEIFSRFGRVEKADGTEVQLAEYLEKVWEVVGRSALNRVLGTAEAQARNGSAGAFEEDARLTALFLWTIKAVDLDGNSTGADDEVDRDDHDDENEGDDGGKKRARGFTLTMDLVRRFAQPLGIHLDNWEGRITETKKGVVRLLPVAERARQLFGEEGIASRIERPPEAASQLEVFPASCGPNPPRSRGRDKPGASPTVMPAPVQATTLDRVHAAMLLQGRGRTSALRALLAAEQKRGPDFRRLANALSALYPRDCDEKRLLDAMLLAFPR